MNIPMLLAAASAAPKAPPAPPVPAQPPPNLPTLKYVPQSGLEQHAGWLTHTFAALFILSALLLIVLLATQTTQREGLSGTLGGRVESAYRGRLGFEGQIARVTMVVAVTFVIVATLVSLSGI